MRRSAATLVVFALLTVIMAGRWAAAQERGAAPDAPSAATQEAWDFNDEASESWGDILRPQALDLALLGGFFALAFTSFFRKSVKLKYVTLVIAVGYMGFVKSHLISIVDIFGPIRGHLPIFKYNLAWYLLAVVVVLSTVLWGRLYCGRMCAFGALTQLLDAAVPARLRIKLPSRIEQRSALTRYVVLAATVLYFLKTHDLYVYRKVEPFWMFGRVATTGLWIALGGLLLATVFVSNLYCRFLCPVGATLGLLSTLTIFRIERSPECNTCKLCEKTCKWGAIRGPKIAVTKCVRCDDCERLALQTKKCPHQILIARNISAASAEQQPQASSPRTSSTAIRAHRSAGPAE